MTDAKIWLRYVRAWFLFRRWSKTTWTAAYAGLRKEDDPNLWNQTQKDQERLMQLGWPYSHDFVTFPYPWEWSSYERTLQQRKGAST